MRTVLGYFRQDILNITTKILDAKDTIFIKHIVMIIETHGNNKRQTHS